MSNYKVFGAPDNVLYKNSHSVFPFHNRWRNNPLSDTSYIQPNVAGYYPYKTIWTTKKANIPNDYEYKWQYVCSTIYPSSESYTKNPEPILYR